MSELKNRVFTITHLRISTNALNASMNSFVIFRRNTGINEKSRLD